jgi:hypothetical protein
MAVLKGKLGRGVKRERLVIHRGARWRTIENINEMDCILSLRTAVWK